MHRIRNAWIMDNARVLGDVTLGDDVSIWCGVAIRGDVAPVTIGARTNVQDNVVVHCDSGDENVIGSDVTIGHAALVHGIRVGSGSLIGIGARLLAGTVIGQGCLVAAGTVVPPRLYVPDGMVVMGVPGRVVRPVSDEERAHFLYAVQSYLDLARRHTERPDDPSVRQYGAD